MLRSFYSCKSSLFPIILFAVCALTQPANAQWSKVGKAFPKFRVEGQYIYHNGTIYVFGGRTTDPTVLQDCLTLNTADPQDWVKEEEPMPFLRTGGYAAAYNDKIYLVGGVSTFNVTADGIRYTFNKSVQEYDPETKVYKQKAAMPYATYDAPGAVIGSKIYIFGGRTQKKDDVTAGEVTKRVQVYDMATDTWTTSTDVPFLDFNPIATAVGNTIYYFGNKSTNKPYGYKGTVGDTITWEPIADCPVKLHLSAVGTMGSYVYLAGGVNAVGGAANQDVFAYNTENNTWSTLGPKLPENGQSVPIMPSDGSSLYYINGMGNFNTYRLSLTTDIAEQVQPALRMYPNPASHTAVVELPENALPGTISLLSLLGDEVLAQTTADKQVVLDIHNLPAGMYTVRYTQGNSVRYRPLIVK